MSIGTWRTGNSPSNPRADVTSIPPPLEHCVRHPHVPTGRHCTRCDRPACNDCLVAASVGSQCLDCVRASRPPRAERVRRWNATQPALATRVLVAANIAVFVWSGLGGAGAFGGGASSRQVQLGLSEIFVANGEWWRIISAGFLHFGALHIAMNMLLLYQLGSLLEPVLGSGRFVLLYFAAMVGGSFGALLLSPDALTGGASGAVFGLMGAAAVALLHRGVNPMQTGIGTTLVLNLLITFAIPGISIGGHLGGVIVGAGVGYVMFDPSVNRQMPWVTWAAPVAAMVACLAAVAAIV
ncbi:MAG: rhomboid family intramembrane serine protease [Actinobacteria bacterium]|nr:rhomboid family intramembrane serine protease [Actinomycetota bacterium]